MTLSDDLKRIKLDVKGAEMRGIDGVDRGIAGLHANIEGLWKAIEAIAQAVEPRQ